MCAKVERDISLPCFNKSVNDLPGEHWRNIPGFEGNYQASSLGRIRSIDRMVPQPRHNQMQLVKGKILSQSVSLNANSTTGKPSVDLRVSMSLEGTMHYFNTRRIIYQTFISNVDFSTDGLCIINIDGDGFNNSVANLAIASRSAKQKRTFARGRQISNLKSANRKDWTKPFGGAVRRRPVNQLQDGKMIATFSSITEAAKSIGGDPKAISMVARNQQQHHHGFQWEYGQ